MARYKHQCVLIDRNTEGYELPSHLRYTWRCVFCGYENHTFEKNYPYPLGCEEPHCAKSTVKIRWWERLLMSVNCRVKTPTKDLGDN